MKGMFYLEAAMRGSRKMLLLMGEGVLKTPYTYSSQPDGASGFDTFNRQGAGADTNSGSLTSLTISSSAGGLQITLIKFDVSSIPANSIISDATLTLYNATTDPLDLTFAVYAILPANSAWTELGATWNYAVNTVSRWAGDVGGDGGLDAGCSVAGTDYFAVAMGSGTYPANSVANTSLDVTLDPTQMKNVVLNNYGFAIRMITTNDTLSFRSSDYGTAGNRPKLVINYLA